MIGFALRAVDAQQHSVLHLAALLAMRQISLSPQYIQEPLSRRIRIAAVCATYIVTGRRIPDITAWENEK